MSYFGIYITKNLLSDLGWPKKRGFLQKEYLSTTILDSVTDNMIDLAACIGANRPKLAARILAEVYSDKDWDGNNAPDIKIYVDEILKEINKKGVLAPHEFIHPFGFMKKTDKVPVGILGDKAVQQAFEQQFTFGVLFGLGHKDNYNKWYEDDMERVGKNMRILDGEKATAPSLHEAIADCEKIVRQYEQEVNTIVDFEDIPKKLLLDIKKIR